MKIEEDRFYKTRDGRKAKSGKSDGKTIRFEVEGEDFGRYVFVDTGRGNTANGSDTPTDLVSVWIENSPVQIKTVKTVVDGKYGVVGVSGHHESQNRVCTYVNGWLTSSELREASVTFTQLADFLEEQGK